MHGLRELEAELHAQSYSLTLRTRLRLTATDVTQHGCTRKIYESREFSEITRMRKQ